MSEMVELDDYNVKPHAPSAKGMRVLGIFPEFPYKEKLANAYGQNIAKEEGIDESIRDTIAKSIKSGEWKPWHYSKPATMEKTDVENINNLLTGFSTMAGHNLADKNTMFIYLVEFFDAPDDSGVMQPADHWRRAWRTRENVEEEFDYIKSKYKHHNILKAAASLLKLGNYAPDDNGVYGRNSISSVLKSVGIKNPTNNWINGVREHINPNVGVMTNANDFDVSDNPKLSKSIFHVTKTFSHVIDGKYDAEVLNDIENQIVENQNTIEENLKEEKDFEVSVVAKTKNAIIEKADKIRENKPKTILDDFEQRLENYRIIIDLIDNHGFKLDNTMKFWWRGQKPNEKAGEIYNYDSN